MGRKCSPPERLQLLLTESWASLCLFCVAVSISDWRDVCMVIAASRVLRGLCGLHPGDSVQWAQTEGSKVIGELGFLFVLNREGTYRLALPRNDLKSVANIPALPVQMMELHQRESRDVLIISDDSDADVDLTSVGLPNHTQSESEREREYCLSAIVLKKMEVISSMLSLSGARPWQGRGRSYCACCFLIITSSHVVPHLMLHA